MAFVSGPRQCGQTTLGQMIARERKFSEYYNWDDIEFRRIWTKSSQSIITETSRAPLIILDEIHKDRTWKRTLKGIYDTHIDCTIALQITKKSHWKMHKYKTMSILVAEAAGAVKIFDRTCKNNDAKAVGDERLSFTHI